MNFYTVRDLRQTPKEIWDDLENGAEVIITNNGKPTTLMLDISDGNFEEMLRTIRQAKAMRAVNSMRNKGEVAGFLDDAAIDEEVKAARKERRGEC